MPTSNEKSKKANLKREMYWLIIEIAELRKTSQKLRRSLQRGYEKEQDNYKKFVNIYEEKGN